MSIQFAGSKSLDDRRRRRLLVNSDDAGADGTTAGEGPRGGVASELVASAAAAPWVPVFEWRLWTYAALIGLGITAAAVLLAVPLAFRPELAPLTQHMLHGERPMLAVLIQTTFCFLSAQLAILITWYRAQCKLDFGGRYRVWPWAAFSFLVAAACSATNAHVLLGQMLEQSELIPWRPRIIAWLLPATLAALPLVVLLDRDVRRSRSSLYTLRLSWVLALATACLELFAADLRSEEWVTSARVILPMYVAATVFVGLWLHARIVAYVCPDPPEAEGATAAAQLFAALRWMASKLVWRRSAKQAEAEPETKPKRSRKKATTETEEEQAAPKRKRRAPAKRATKPRTRKVVEVEEEEVEEEQESGYDYESDSASDGYEAEAEETVVENNDWEEESEPEPEPEPPPPPVRSNRDSRDNKPAPQYSAPKKASGWEEEPEAAASESDDGDEEGDDATLRRDDGEDPLKGLSKRQKRELRRQQRKQGR